VKGEGLVKKNKTVVTVISKISEHATTTQSCLVVIYGLDLGRKYNLEKNTVIIGRSSKCDIQVDQESVSRNHAKIINSGEDVVLCDMGSTNGTYINDELVQEHTLSDGNLIKIGRTIFKFLSGKNIENAYHEEIYRLTTIDGLTQVFNKRYFMETLERELSRSRRYGRDLSLVIFDIDHFKNVNDTFGHLAGDYILKQLAELVKLNIRREDFLARYGGEEFAVILPELEHLQAMRMADKVIKLISEYDFLFEGNHIPITVSIGVATLNEDVSEAIEFIKIADTNLYEAKKTGRDRVVG
jgi:two-component system cell cycle response regulator